MVMLHHVDVSRRFLGGRAGVDVFFVISGFLITSLLVNEYDRRGGIDLAEFYRRRAYRLLPALLVMLGGVVAYAGIYDAVRNGRGIRDLLKATLFAAVYASNWAAAFGARIPFELSHLWSLAVEEQFYLLAPLALVVLLPRVPRRLLLGVVLSAGACGLLWRLALEQSGASRDRLRFGLDTHADGLLLGCALGLAFASGIAPKLFAASAGKRRIGPIALLALGVVAALPAMPGELVWSVSVFSALGGVAVWSVLGQREGVHVRLLEAPIVQRIGRLSYALYLWNTPVTVYVYARMGTESPLALRVAVAWVLTYALAEISMKLVEVPVRKLRDRRALRLAPLPYQSVGV